MSHRTAKIWASDEPEPPDGKVSNLTSAGPGWFSIEEPDDAAELYALERGVGEYKVTVVDTGGGIWTYEISVRREVVVHVKDRMQPVCF